MAVDPTTVPLRSTVLIRGYRYRAEDTGGDIKGNRIDIWFPSCAKAIRWGVRRIRIWFWKPHELRSKGHR